MMRSCCVRSLDSRARAWTAETHRAGARRGTGLSGSVRRPRRAQLGAATGVPARFAVGRVSQPTPFLHQHLILILIEDFARISGSEPTYRHVVIFNDRDNVPHAGDELVRPGLEPSDSVVWEVPTRERRTRQMGVEPTVEVFQPLFLVWLELVLVAPR